MSLSPYISRMPSRVAAAFSRVRWHDASTHAWGLIGGLFVFGIVWHYLPGKAPGEKKNDCLQLLTDLGSAENGSWRPSVGFVADAAAVVLEDGHGADLDLRGFAAQAAVRPDWRFVPASVRSKLAALPQGVARITVIWSGTEGGDAEALDLYHTNILGHANGTPWDFVIGNGHRGSDGRIEATRHWEGASGTATEEICICLTGSGHASRAQEIALGELITCIEARSGCVSLAMHQPLRPALLADAD